jgi:predicted O-methyltransferase YrrM
MTKLLIAEELNDYAERYTSPETPVLAELKRETYNNVGQPHMLSGHLQGALLQMISHMLKPKRVLELGTFTGYSAICLAQGLPDDGQLHTIDVDERLEETTRKYFREAWVDQKITRHFGKAADIIPELDETFDLVFIDADKRNYGLYYDLVFDKVPVGGFILADNVLFEGEVTLPDDQMGKTAKFIHAFNEKVNKDPRIERLLLPIRDGIMIMRKIAAV